MAKNTIGILFIFSLIVVFSLAWIFMSANADEASLIISAQTDKMICRIGESLNIIAYLKNKSGETLEIIEPALERSSFLIEVVHPNNTTETLLNVYGLKLKTVRLLPGKRIKFTAKFIPEKLGEYKIKVQYLGFGVEPLVAKPIKIFAVRLVEQ